METRKLKPAVRYLAEMKELLFDQDWAKTAPDDLELYYMYRDLTENEKDQQKIIEQGLRYDITVLLPVMLGKEFNKTAGHDHALVPGTDLTYPEIYQVLAGQAIFLLQDSIDDKIKDVYAIKARPNDRIIIPPNYEHLIINISADELKTANWVCRDFESNIYKPFRQKHGFGYFALKNEAEEINWVKNENYAAVSSLKFLEPNLWMDKFGLLPEKEIYQLVNDLAKLDFLKNPQKYDWR